LCNKKRTINNCFFIGIDEEDSGTPLMQQTQLNQTNRIQQTPTPPPQSNHQQSAPLLAQLQTPTSSSQVNITNFI